MSKFISLREAVALIPDGCRLGIGGFCGFGAPDSLLREMGKAYLETGSPKDLSVVTGACAGDGTEDGFGMSLLRHDGMLREIYSSIATLPVAIRNMVSENKIAAYYMPLGVVGHIFRAMAGGEPGLLTHVGLNTFCDPREEGGKMNQLAKESGKDIVRLMEVDGKDYLFYYPLPMDVCIIRGTFADSEGNVSCEQEAVHSEHLALASAVHNTGGTVIFEVQQVVEKGSLDPRRVTVHKSLVDYVVVSNPGEHMQGYFAPTYRPELCGEARIPLAAVPPMPLNLRKIVARRGAMELKKGALINLGLGISEGVSIIANEEGISDQISLTIETGIMGGVPLAGGLMGAGVNTEALYTMPETFDLYNGGGLDQAFLSGAEIDQYGNVNVSKFSGRTIGVGGFINIAQNTRQMHFLGIFTAGKVQADFEGGQLNIRKDGTGIKFVKKVEQISFSGKYAAEHGQKVMFITDRAVFCLTPAGLELIEIAPGVDLQKHILDKMEFTPLISPDLRLMDKRIFLDQPMGLTLD